MLISIANNHDITWRSIEIADNNQLLEAYGTTIPVIQITGISSEIKWPFGAEEILALVKTDTIPK